MLSDRFDVDESIRFPNSPNRACLPLGGGESGHGGAFFLRIVNVFVLKEILHLQENILPEGKELTHFLHNFFVRQFDFLPSL